MTIGRRDRLAAIGFLSPALATLVVLRIVPTIRAAVDSVHSALPGSTLPPEGVGLDNFSALLRSDTFWSSVKQTLIFNVLVNPLQVVVALALAVLLTQRPPGTAP
jgi:multiple sugar transport system permease protein